METANNSQATTINVNGGVSAGVPQGTVTEIRITPEQYMKMPEADKARLDPAMRASLEQACAIAQQQASAMPPLPNVVQPVNADKCITVDAAKAAAEQREAARKAFLSLPLKERKEITREEQKDHAKAWYHLHAVDIRNSNDQAAMLLGAVIATLLIVGGIIIVRMIKSE